MVIEKLSLKNFRGLLDETIDFDKSLTVFAGMNGGGKSSALEAIAIMLSWLPVKISSMDGAGKKIKFTDVTYGAKYAELEMSLRNSKGEPMTLKMCKYIGSHKKGNSDGMRAAEEFGADMRILLDSKEGVSAEIPVFAYYGADRNAIGFASPLPSSARESVYSKAFNAGTDIKTFANWFVKMSLSRDAEIDEAAAMPLKKGNERRAEIEKKYAFLRIVKNALAEISPEFGSFCVRDGKLFLSAKNVPAAFLSQGEKAVVALIADIALRMVVANPFKTNPLETEAIILVDELDIHLHPSWQAAIAEKIQKIFPRTQFVISTHSPTVLSFAKVAYRLASVAGGCRFERVDSQYGRNPADILTNVMESKRERSVEAKFRTIYECIDRGKFGAAGRLIDELSDVLPDDPELLRVEYIYRALSAPKGK